METNLNKPYEPSPDDVASFVDTLKDQIRENTTIAPYIVEAIKNLPSSRSIRSQMSHSESAIVFETVRWAWKEITGKDLVDLDIMEKKPESLLGNYWLLTNGLIIGGTNHYTMVKQNLNLFQTILSIHAFTLHTKLSGEPNDLIKLVIDNGGVRVFITEDKRSYFQMNDKIYSEWGRAKIKNMKYDKKIVKLIDAKTNYKGWDSGITIIL